MTKNVDFTNLRLRLAIRKALISLRDHRIHRNVLHLRYKWATREQVEGVVDELLREGLLTEEKGAYGAPILVWHEEKIDAAKKKDTKTTVQVLEGVKAGMTNLAIAEELGIHRNTVCYHLKKLRGVLQQKSATELQKFVHEQVLLLSQLVEEVHSGELHPEKANAIRGMMSSIAKLTGSNAPSKSLSMRLNANINLERVNDPSIPAAQLTDDELKLRAAQSIFDGHTDAQIDQIREYADSLPRLTPDEEQAAELARNEARLEALFSGREETVVDAEFKDRDDEEKP